MKCNNTLYMDAHAGLWKIEDFLYRAAIATPRSIPWGYPGAVDNALYMDVS
jgi:hypothetical protein